MQNFIYKATKYIPNDEETKNKLFTGMIMASSTDDAYEKLTKMGYDVIKIKKSFFNLFNDHKLSQKEMVNFFSSIAAIDKVGIDILHILELMKNDVADSDNLKKVCEKIYFSVASGSSLSVACSEASSSFTHDLVGLIKIAEQTGKFDKIFTEIVEYIKWNYDIKMRAKKAIRGPLATFGFMIAIIIIMSTFILPKIIDFISYFEVETPIYTQILITFATFIKTKWYIIGLSILFVCCILKILSYANNSIGVKLDYLKLKIPIFGNLILKIDTSRFITFFSIMYRNNTDILEIMTSVSNIVSNKYFGKKILVVRDKIADGKTIFASINQEPTFPVMFRKMMAICDTTGEVGTVLENVKYFYETEVKDTTEKIVGLIKPMTTVLLGIMVAWIGIAMLMPIYAHIGNINNITIPNAEY